MRQELLLVDGRYRFDRLDLDDDFTLDNQVRSEPEYDVSPFVDDRNRLLADCAQASLLEFVRQDGFVDRFQQAWSESCVNAVRRVYDFFCEFVFCHWFRR